MKIDRVTEASFCLQSDIFFLFFHFIPHARASKLVSENLLNTVGHLMGEAESIVSVVSLWLIDEYHMLQCLLSTTESSD